MSLLRTCTWLMTSIGLVATTLCLASMFWTVGIRVGRGCEVLCGRGIVSVFEVQPGVPLAARPLENGPIFLSRSPPRPTAWFRIEEAPGKYRLLDVAIWKPAVASVLCGGFILYRTRASRETALALVRRRRDLALGAMLAAFRFRTSSRVGMVLLGLAVLLLIALIPTRARGAVLGRESFIGWGGGVAGGRWRQGTLNEETLLDALRKTKHWGPFFELSENQPRSWWFGYNRAPSDVYLFVPLWCPALLSASLGAALCIRRRYRLGHCPHCNYNLTGLPPNSPCPECGRARTSQSATHPEGP